MLILVDVQLRFSEMRKKSEKCIGNLAIVYICTRIGKLILKIRVKNESKTKISKIFVIKNFLSFHRFRLHN